MIKNVLTSKEVANVLDVSASTACKYIKRMNEEMENKDTLLFQAEYQLKCSKKNSRTTKYRKKY